MPDKRMFITITFIFALVSLTILIMMVRRIAGIFLKKRKFSFSIVSGSVFFGVATLLLAGAFYLLYNLPAFLFGGIPWAMIEEYGPASLLYAVYSLVCFIAVLYLFSIISFYFKKTIKNPGTGLKQ
ncbi:MAG: hypothetical protein N2645_16670 [Clostridia bacterium]|nr:hypothetical protein [Clostridia bacterium]